MNDQKPLVLFMTILTCFLGACSTESLSLKNVEISSSTSTSFSSSFATSRESSSKASYRSIKHVSASSPSQNAAQEKVQHPIAGISVNDVVNEQAFISTEVRLSSNMLQLAISSGQPLTYIDQLQNIVNDFGLEQSNFSDLLNDLTNPIYEQTPSFVQFEVNNFNEWKQRVNVTYNQYVNFNREMCNVYGGC